MEVLVETSLDKSQIAKMRSSEALTNLGQDTGAVRKTDRLIGQYLETEARHYNGYTVQIACPRELKGRNR